MTTKGIIHDLVLPRRTDGQPDRRTELPDTAFLHFSCQRLISLVKQKISLAHKESHLQAILIGTEEERRKLPKRRQRKWTKRELENCVTRPSDEEEEEDEPRKKSRRKEQQQQQTGNQEDTGQGGEVDGEQGGEAEQQGQEAGGQQGERLSYPAVLGGNMDNIGTSCYSCAATIFMTSSGLDLQLVDPGIDTYSIEQFE